LSLARAAAFLNWGCVANVINPRCRINDVDKILLYGEAGRKFPVFVRISSMSVGALI
jgi:hypothetical protein